MVIPRATLHRQLSAPARAQAHAAPPCGAADRAARIELVKVVGIAIQTDPSPPAIAEPRGEPAGRILIVRDMPSQAYNSLLNTGLITSGYPCTQDNAASPYCSARCPSNRAVIAAITATWNRPQPRLGDLRYGRVDRVGERMRPEAILFS